MFESSFASEISGMPGLFSVPDSKGFFEASRPGREFRQLRIGTYLLSNLFAASFMGRSGFVKDKDLVGLSRNKRVAFTGETFDQWDLDVLLHCAMRSPGARGAAGKVQVDAAALLREARLRNSEENREQVYASLFRLHTGSLCIEGDGYRSMTRLLDRVLLDQTKERCLVEVNRDIVNALSAQRSWYRAFDSRFALRRNGLAKWLQGVVLAFSGGFKADIPSLHTLCGMSSRTRYIFPKLVVKALHAMEEAGIVDSWQVEGGRVVVLPRNRQRSDGACGVITFGSF
ncbi:hypothetical protein GKC30_09565 [Pseudodesulfovibrio sp. F-1]|uniref:TrfA family protein n=1 Tax=Pseudodesulfovibrio alkaliphilus TaxID=2661613 RepID=A0A7K1KPS7_9BACT|nr:hypothetical protein [Pseudodesulfovibrio alkaliphilus]MUM77881.1 hypothetical protein [Pseudodesulfovibrio alkaliphilus]